MRVAIYGGSFNPPHLGHLLALIGLKRLGLCDRVLVVPVYAHAFAKQMVPFPQRLELCARAFGWLPWVMLSDIESRLPAPSYTLNTLEALREAHPDWELRLVVGEDILSERDKWHRFEQVVELAPLLLLGRGEVRPPEPLGWRPALDLPDISSTEIRQALRGRSGAEQLLGAAKVGAGPALALGAPQLSALRGYLRGSEFWVGLFAPLLRSWLAEARSDVIAISTEEIGLVEGASDRPGNKLELTEPLGPERAGWATRLLSLADISDEEFGALVLRGEGGEDEPGLLLDYLLPPGLLAHLNGQGLYS